MADPSTTTAADVWFDVGCPWTWVTTRWLTEISRRRDLTLRWHPFSLWLKNGESTPPPFRAKSQASLRSLRVIVRLAGDHAVGDSDERRDADARVAAFYAERGRRLFVDDEPVDDEAVLTACGFDPALAAAADDESLDAVIRASMDTGWAAAGSSAGSPIVAVGGKGLFGPVLAGVPAADDADRLWAHVSGLLELADFYEIKRDRSGPPRLTPG